MLKRKQVKTKELILQNSFILFLEKGYKEVSLNEILKKCEISKGAFYHHYKSKDELYLKVLDRFFFQYFSKQDVDYSDSTLLYKINYFVGTFLSPYKEIGVILKSNQVSAYFRFLFQAVNNYSEIRARVNKHFYTKGYYIYQIIEIAKKNNEVKENIDTKTMARQILSTIVGVLILEGINDIENIELRFSEIVDEYYKLIKV
jgi:AcrR family transcriptional regulator